MKEQANVEASENYPLVCTACGNSLIKNKHLIIKLSDYEDYTRLKRLHNNVKKEIVNFKVLLDAGYSNDITIPRLIKLLESLDK